MESLYHANLSYTSLEPPARCPSGLVLGPPPIVSACDCIFPSPWLWVELPGLLLKDALWSTCCSPGSQTSIALPWALDSRYPCTLGPHLSHKPGLGFLAISIIYYCATNYSSEQSGVKTTTILSLLLRAKSWGKEQMRLISPALWPELGWKGWGMMEDGLWRQHSKRMSPTVQLLFQLRLKIFLMSCWPKPVKNQA